ncbi:hypothetical protein B0T22DRAFT_189072, partial [Podospora appendiculata]
LSISYEAVHVGLLHRQQEDRQSSHPHIHTPLQTKTANPLPLTYLIPNVPTVLNMIVPRIAAAAVFCLLGLAHGGVHPPHGAPPHLTGGHPDGVALYAEPDFLGQLCTVSAADLAGGACVTIPQEVRATSFKKSGSPCCILYRSACDVVDKSPNGRFLNQRIFADEVANLTMYGWGGIVRGVVCPAKNICDGLKADKDFAPESDDQLKRFWADILTIPGRRLMGP